MTDRRTHARPDGLAASGLTRRSPALFGLSRSRAADLATDGEVSVNGSTVSKSHPGHAEDPLEVVLRGPEPSVIPRDRRRTGPRHADRHDDDEIVVVDKLVGVACPPQPSEWTG